MKDTENKERGIEASQYDAIFTEAIKIFSDQALLSKDSGDITLKDIQLAKGKSENFLNSIGGMLEISHKVELLSAERHKFKRADELKLLNSLRVQFEKSADFSGRMIDMCMHRMDTLEIKMSEGEITGEDLMQISSLQEFMLSAIGTLSVLSKGTSTLIKTERESGGRSSGDPKISSTNITTFLEDVGDPDSKKPVVRPRKISTAELMDNMGGSKDRAYLDDSE